MKLLLVPDLQLANHNQDTFTGNLKFTGKFRAKTFLKFDSESESESPRTSLDA